MGQRTEELLLPDVDREDEIFARLAALDESLDTASVIGDPGDVPAVLFYAATDEALDDAISRVRALLSDEFHVENVLTGTEADLAATQSSRRSA